MKGVKKLDNTILLNVKIQAIYFQTPTNELGIKHATSDKRITLAEAEDILLEREIPYHEILKVKYEDKQLEIPLTNYENYIL